MDDLLIKYILEETTSEESNQVQQWLAADVANLARFKKLQAVWQLAAQPTPQVPTDAQQALQRLKQTLRARETVPHTRGIKRIGRRVQTTAAAVAGIAFLALGAYVWLKQNNPVKEQPPGVHPDTVQQQPLQADTTPTVQPVPPRQTDAIPYVRPHKKKRVAPVAPVAPVQPARPKKRAQPAQPTDTTHSKKKHPVPSQSAQPVRKHKTPVVPKEAQSVHPVRKHKTAPKPKEAQPVEPPIS